MPENIELALTAAHSTDPATLAQNAREALLALAAVSDTPEGARALWRLRRSVASCLDPRTLPRLLAVEVLVEDEDAFEWTTETEAELEALRERFVSAQGRNAVRMAERIADLEYSKDAHENPPEREVESRHLACPVCKNGPADLVMVDAGERYTDIDTEHGVDADHDKLELRPQYDSHPDLHSVCLLAQCCGTPVSAPLDWSFSS